MKLFTTGIALAVILTLTACSTVDAMDSRMRPDGVRADEYALEATFDNALNLTQGAPVKANGVVIGRVVGIETADYRARVRLAISEEDELREGTGATLRYTTALGELYVEMTPTKQGELLADGDTLGVQSTTTAPTVEDTLASASLLVNGGNLGQIQTIVDELNVALEGRVGTAKDVIAQTDTFLQQVLASTREIDRVLTALNGASQTLREREGTINRALQEVAPAADVLQRNTDELAQLLRNANAMARTTDGLVRRTRDDVRNIVEQLGPTLNQLLAHEQPLLRALGRTNEYARLLDRAVPTDYLNLWMVLRLTSGLQSVALPPLDLSLLNGQRPDAQPDKRPQADTEPPPRAILLEDLLGLGGLLGGGTS